jgi:Flp pilus assembly protein TadD
MKYTHPFIFLGLLCSCTPQTAINTDSLEQSFDSVAIAELEVTIKDLVQESPEKAYLRFLLGKAYLFQGKYVNAEKELSTYQEQVNVDVLDNEFYELYAEALFLTEVQVANSDIPKQAIEKSEKIKHIIELQSIDIKDVELSQESTEISQENFYQFYFNAEALFAKREYEKAVELFEKLSNLRANDDRMLFYIMLSLYKIGNFEEANVVSNKILLRQDNNAIANLVKASYRLSNRNYEEARLFGNKALREGLESAELRIVMGIANYHLENFEQAHNHLTKFQDVVERNPDIKKYLIATELELGILDVESTKLPSDEMGVILGLQALEFVEADNSEQSLNALLDFFENTDIENESLKHITDLILLSRGSGSVNKNGLNKFVRESSKESLSLLVSAYLAGGDNESALELIDELLQDAPENTNILTLKAATLLKLGDEEQAEQVFNQLLTIDPKNIIARKHFAFKALNEQQYTDSLSQFKAILADEYSTTAITGFIISATSSNTLNQGIEWLEELLDKRQGSPALAVDIAFLKYRTGDKEASLAYLNQAAKAESKPENYFVLLAAIKRNESDDKGFDSVISDWIAQEGINQRVLRVALNYYESEQKWDKGLQFSDLVENSTNRELAVYGKLIKGYFLSRTNQIPKAKILFSGAHDENNYFALKADAIIMSTEGKWQPALEKYKRAYDILSSTENALFVLRAYQALKMVDASIEFADQHLSQHPNDASFELRYAEWLLVHSPQKSIQLYSKMVDGGHKTPAVLNNLAWLLLQNKEVEKADQLINQALDLQPDVFNIVDTAVEIKLELGNSESALAVLDKAIEANSLSFDLKVLRVETLIRLEKYDEARIRLKNMSPTSSKENAQLKILESKL